MVVTTLMELAKVIRSKNSGPFEVTFDVLFDNPESYWRVKNSGVINEETVCSLYQITPDQISHIVFFDQALGFKITILREISSGTSGDRDVYGAQQHAPLLYLAVQGEVRR
jgi:hypothetical protein